MAWVRISDQTEVTATLSASGNPFEPMPAVEFDGGTVFPLGGHGRGEYWTLTFSKPCRIGIELSWDPAPIPPGLSVGGGFAAGDIYATYFDDAGKSLLTAPAWTMLDSGFDVIQLDYAPAFDPPDASWFANHYNCQVYVWQEGGGGGGGACFWTDEVRAVQICGGGAPQAANTHVILGQ